MGFINDQGALLLSFFSLYCSLSLFRHFFRPQLCAILRYFRPPPYYRLTHNPHTCMPAENTQEQILPPPSECLVNARPVPWQERDGSWNEVKHRSPAAHTSFGIFAHVLKDAFGVVEACLRGHGGGEDRGAKGSVCGGE